jgi:hypothetical protein
MMGGAEERESRGILGEQRLRERYDHIDETNAFADGERAVVYRLGNRFRYLQI